MLAGDVPGLRANGTAGDFDTSSVRLVLSGGLPAGSTLSPDGRTLVVPGEGVHTVDPATGEVTFDPDTAFVGTTSPVTYTVLDQADNQASSSYTVTVTPITPTAADDGAKTASGDPVTVDALANDTAGDPSAPLVPSSVVLTDPDATLGGTRLVVPSEGEWVVNPSGTVTFTPEAGFDGATEPVEYRVSDDNGETATATITVVVGSDALAVADLGSTPQDIDVTVDPLVNDIPGDQGTPCTPPGSSTPAGCDTGTFDPTSVVFGPIGQPTGATPTDAGKQLVVANEGTYTVDPGTGAITFDPEPAFRGEASPVFYTVEDSYSNTVSATLTVTVRPISPDATDDARNTAYDTPVTLPATTNDSPGTDDNGTPGDSGDDVTPALVPAATVFPAAGQPAGAVRSSGDKVLTMLGQGVWTIQTDGSVVFNPDPDFSGTTSTVIYQIEDENGAVDTATLIVQVRSGPQLVADTATTSQNVDVILTPLDNDTPGLAADGATGTWDVSSLVFPLAGQPAGAVPTMAGKELVVPDQGTYTIAANGEVTFNPDSSFSGPAEPVAYEVTDSLGNAGTATITIIVTAVTPTALDDSARTPSGEAVVIDVLDNDEAGSGAPLVPATLELLDPLTDEPVAEVVVPGEGTWTVVDSRVRFAPVDGFEGAATPVRYVVEDVNGTPVEATVRVFVEGAGESRPSSVETSQGEPVTVDVLDNVTPAEGETLPPATVCLLPATVLVDGNPRPGGAASDDCVEKYTLRGVGTWVVNPSGSITFSPAAGFSGVATIDFQVQDTGGNTYQDELSVEVKAQPAQAAAPPAVQTTTPVADLPDAGGPALGWVLGGALSLLFGLALVRRFR